MAIEQYDDAFWNQFPVDEGSQTRSFDPTQRSANTGINGGSTAGPATLGGLTPTDQVAQTQMAQPGANWGGGGQVTMQAFNDAWLQSPYPGTVDGLKQFMAAHPEYAAAGITLGGSKGDKVYGPGGAYWGDAVIAAGAGGQGKSGLSGPGGGGGGNTLAGLGYGFGSSMAPFTEGFSAPNPEQIANDPYYKFQLGEGMKSIQNSAAAKGTLLSGGTLKGLEQYGQGLASSFGDKAYDRGMGEYLLRRQNFYDTQDRPFSKSLSLAQLGRPQ